MPNGIGLINSLEDVAHFTILCLEGNIPHQNLGAILFLLCHLSTTYTIILSPARKKGILVYVFLSGDDLHT